MASKTGTCRLCGQEQIKFVDSHIIPKSMWGNTLGCKSGAAKLYSTSKGHRPKRSPKGEYDRGILCFDCESSFSPWDDYAYKIFFENVFEPVFYDDGEPLACRLDGCDFFKLKMFFISLIWRMHVTERMMFQSVDIGSYYDKLTLALIQENPDIIPELDAVVTRFDDKLSEIMVGPVNININIDGVKMYLVRIASHSFRIKIDKRQFPPPLDELAISSGKPLHFILQDFSDSVEKELLKKLISVIKVQ